MSVFLSRLTPLLAALSLCAAAQASEAITKKVDGVLADHAGMTLYTFDKDLAGSGKSACNGPCAQTWPPLAGPETAGAPFSVLTREDGGKQLAYKGKPLYRYGADQKPGDRNGDNYKQLWHVVKD